MHKFSDGEIQLTGIELNSNQGAIIGKFCGSDPIKETKSLELEITEALVSSKVATSGGGSAINVIFLIVDLPEYSNMNESF
jgi:hypothetical protein